MPEASTTAVLVVAETRDSVVTPLTLELLGLAQRVAIETAGSVCAVLIGDHANAADVLVRYGADRVYVCGEPAGEEYEGELWLPAIAQIAREVEPLAILCAHTTSGADLAPRLAFRLRSGIATACESVAVESGRLLFTRPCYGGKVRETLSFSTSSTVATIKAGVGTAASDTSRKSTILRFATPPSKARARIVARARDASEATRLEDARIVVAGGRGLEGPDGFRVLQSLADALGATVGSSRVPCDLGWCPHSWQIGLTGKTVTPDLYVAVGISGASHHMAGCGNAKTIVAINTDPDAAIFREARFGLVGDYRKLLPALVTALGEVDENPSTPSAAGLQQ